MSPRSQSLALILLLIGCGSGGEPARSPAGPVPGVDRQPAETETATASPTSPAAPVAAPEPTPDRPPGAGAEVVPQRVHRDPVRIAVALSRRHAAAASDDGGLSIIDLRDGRVRAARRLDRPPTALVADRRGRKLLVVGGPQGGLGDTKLLVWDLWLDTWTELRLPDAGMHVDPAVTPALSPDGRRVAVIARARPHGELERDLVLIPTGRGRLEEQPLSAPAAVLAFDPQGRALAVAGPRGLSFVDGWTGRPLPERPTLEAPVEELHSAQSASWLVAGGDGRAFLVETEAGGAARDITPEGLTVDDVALAGDGSRVILCDPAGRVRVLALPDLSEQARGRLEAPCRGARSWLDPRGARPALFFRAHGDLYRQELGAEPLQVATGPSAVALAAPEPRALVLAADGVRLFEPDADELRRLIEVGRTDLAPFQLDVGPDGPAALHGGRRIEVGAVAGGGPAAARPVPPVAAPQPGTSPSVARTDDGTRALVVVPGSAEDGFRYALLSSDRAAPVDLRRPPTGLARTCPDGRGGSARCPVAAVFSPDGTRVAVRTDEATWVYAADGRLVGRAQAGTVVWGPRSAAFAVVGDDRSVDLHGRDGGARVTVMVPQEPGAIDPVEVAFDADGRFIAAVRGRRLVLVDVATGQRMPRIVLPGLTVGPPRFARDAATVRVWTGDSILDVSTGDGHEVARVEAENVVAARAGAVAVCADGRLRVRRQRGEVSTEADMGPCPAGEVRLDDDVVTVDEGDRARILDDAGTRLSVRLLRPGWPVAVAWTPAGRIEAGVQDLDVALRSPGPLLLARLSSLPAPSSLPAGP